jgi:hypothetical protein
MPGSACKVSNEVYFIVPIAFSVILFGALMIGFNLDKMHAVLKLFFIWISVFMLVPLVEVGRLWIESMSLPDAYTIIANTFEYIFIMVCVVFTVYMLIYILKITLQSALPQNKLRVKA